MTMKLTRRGKLAVGVAATALLIGLGVGVNSLLPPPAGVEMIPCTSDGVDPREEPNCYWNANTMGNGQGTSFVIINGNVKELP